MITCPTTNKNRSLARSLKERTGNQVSPWTVQRRVYECNIRKCRKTKKPFVNQLNRRKRIEFVHQHRHWAVQDWNNVIWSNQSPFHLRCHNNQMWSRIISKIGELKSFHGHRKVQIGTPLRICALNSIVSWINGNATARMNYGKWENIFISL